VGDSVARVTVEGARGVRFDRPARANVMPQSRQRDQCRLRISAIADTRFMLIADTVSR
jgi:hypothetical protein